MNTELLSFALKNIWCSPSQDQQHYFKLKKISKGVKSRGTIRVVERFLKLPDMNDYAVYTIGQISPTTLNLQVQDKDWFKDIWVSFKDLINTRALSVFIYDNDGTMVPMHLCKFTFIDEHTLVVCIKNTGLDFVDLTKLNIKTYSNSYYNSKRYDHALGYMEYNGVKVQSMQTILDMQNRISFLRNINDGVMCFRNGKLISDIDPLCRIGDYIEYHYDSSIRSIEKYKVKELTTFLSIQDSVRKFLIYRKNKPEYIQFYDDNEFFIITNNQIRDTGLYYYRHNLTATSMVTDKDYSLNVDYVYNVINNIKKHHPQLTEDSFSIMVVVREAGLQRDLIYSDLRLHELYKLPHSIMKDTLNNTHNSVDILRAEYLENSPYFKIAEMEHGGLVTSDLTIDALGYNAISKYYADMPVKSKLVMGNKYVNIPYLFMNKSTGFEYNEIGELIGYKISSGPVHICSSVDAHHVEFIQGHGDYTEQKYGIGSITVDNSKSYRVYQCFIFNDIIDHNWSDVTNSPRLLRLGDTVTIDEPGIVLKVRYTDSLYILNTDIPMTDGVLYFPIVMRYPVNNDYTIRKLDIPYANMDIFLNKRLLIEGLDYYVDFPNINIVNKKYLTDSDKQNIIIRANGFTLEDMSTPSYNDAGFIYHGKLSSNNTFDIRDDRVTSLFIDGLLKDKNTLECGESSSTVNVTHSLNGLPYILKEPYINIDKLTNKNTHDLRLLSKTKDKKISEYFTLVLPETKYVNPSSVQSRYIVYSPFISKIIHDLLDGGIDRAIYVNSYTDQEVINIANRYEHLLKLDPIKNIPDNKFVNVHPHPYNNSINVDVYQYRFLENVVRLYCKEVITLSGHLNMAFS